MWGVIFWDGRRVLLHAAVTEQQRLGSGNVRHSFLLGLEARSLRLQYWHGPGLLPSEDDHLLTVPFKPNEKIIPLVSLFIRMHTHIGASAYDLG